MKKLIFIVALLIISCSNQESFEIAEGRILNIEKGAKTGSLYQASLSYSTNKIINDIKEKKNNKKITENEKTKKISENFKKHQILVSIPLDILIISELFEPEPLP